MRPGFPLSRSLPRLSVLLLLVACDHAVDRADLPGVYVLRPDRIGADTLRLLDGGRYERSFASPKGAGGTAAGRWDVRRQGAQWALALTPPDSLSDGAYLPSLPPYIRPLRSWRPGRALRLPIDDATGAAYERIGP